MKLTEKFVQFISSLFFMMFLGIGIIRTEKCWPNSPTYSTDVGVLRGWGRAQITVDILGREAKKVIYPGLWEPTNKSRVGSRIPAKFDC